MGGGDVRIHTGAARGNHADLDRHAARTDQPGTYGTGQVEVYRVQGMGHGTPVDPGSATTQCGATGPYFLDFICSSYHTARFWAWSAEASGVDSREAGLPGGPPSGARRRG